MNQPLAERLRPTTLDHLVGQAALVGTGKPLRRLIDGLEEGAMLPSMIFWGPPGVGKTTVARVIAEKLGSDLKMLSAVEAGVADIRAAIELAENMSRTGQHLTLFLDEIHRFNKSQQDRLLKAVEEGVLTLIGATTENPSFEVNSALLSRSRVFMFSELTADDLDGLLNRALKEEIGLADAFKLTDDARGALIQFSGGDARVMLGALELAAQLCDDATIELRDIEAAYGDKKRRYDASGEEHYNTVSAFIKSMRGSNPDAAVYYLARMLAGGEDPKFIARRMVIFASEDIGNAMPNALVLATSCFMAVEKVGYPECQIMLSQTAIYLARAPKSRASYDAIQLANQVVQDNQSAAVPLHLRNPVSGVVKQEGYGKGYKMPGEAGAERQIYMPDELKSQQLYHPSGEGMEQ